MVTMSQKEFQRVKVIENAAGGRLSVREASRLLQLSERQVQRLKRRYRPDSVSWVRHGNRGRPMPWAVSVPQKQLVLQLARGKYQGFNDSHLAEKLREEEHLPLSREVVRRILRGAKLASPQKRRPRQYRSRRPPRPRFGMMALTRRQPSRLARRPRPRTHAARFSGRRHPHHPRRPLPTRSRKHRRLHVLAAHHDPHPRHSAHPLSRSPRHLPAQRCPLDPGRTTRRKTIAHPARARPRPTRHRPDPRLLAPSQGPHRARLAHLAGRRPAPRTTQQKPKPKMPRIYNLSGRPALAAVT